MYDVKMRAGLCRSGCTACAEACPTKAITGGESARIDLGRCLLCSDCVEACPEGAISFTNDYRLVVRRREDLAVLGNQDALPLAVEPGAELGRSLKLRQVSAGGCNGCELDTNVLNTVGWDLGRFGCSSWRLRDTRTACSSPARSPGT